jgi:hypothetical protein
MAYFRFDLEFSPIESYDLGSMARVGEIRAALGGFGGALEGFAMPARGAGG